MALIESLAQVGHRVQQLHVFVRHGGIALLQALRSVTRVLECALVDVALGAWSREDALREIFANGFASAERGVGGDAVLRWERNG